MKKFKLALLVVSTFSSLSFADVYMSQGESLIFFGTRVYCGGNASYSKNEFVCTIQGFFWSNGGVGRADTENLARKYAIEDCISGATHDGFQAKSACPEQKISCEIAKN